MSPNATFKRDISLSIKSSSVLITHTNVIKHHFFADMNIMDVIFSVEFDVCVGLLILWEQN